MRLKYKKWFIIPVFAILLMSHNAFALDLSEEVVIDEVFKSPYWSDSNTPTNFINTSRTYSNNANYSGATSITLKTSSNYAISAPAGTYFVVNGTVIAYSNDPGYVNQSTFLGLSTASVDCPVIDLDVDEVSSDLNSSTQHRSTRFTYTATCRLSSAVTTGPTLNIYLATATPQSGSISYVMQMNAMVRATADTSLSAINTKLGTISNYLQNIYSVNNDILDKLNEIATNEEKEQESVENIEGQTPSDISSDGNTENAQTQSLIASLGGFLSALQGLSATNCNVTLQFPNFAGGNMVVNVCQNKEYTGNIVSVAGSILLVLFYLPLAFVMVNMIYREIRSFTNG